MCESVERNAKEGGQEEVSQHEIFVFVCSVIFIILTVSERELRLVQSVRLLIAVIKEMLF